MDDFLVMLKAAFGLPLTRPALQAVWGRSLSMQKPHLLLLHGALGASAQFDPLRPLLTEYYHLHLLDFDGHGSAAPSARPFRIEHFADNVLTYLGHHAIEQIDIFGYSMGGYVGLYLATIAPTRVGRIATLGTKFRWDTETAAREVALLNPERIAAKVPHFAQALAERHPITGWETVVRKTADLLQALGEHPVLAATDWRTIAHPVRIHIGDRDTTVSIEESVEVYRSLAQGELVVLPQTPHPLEKVAYLRLAHSLLDFFR
jgi:pimeloyl-ACP methyl ester carboxylesterase